MVTKPTSLACIFLLLTAVAPCAHARETRDQIRYDNKGDIVAVCFQNTTIALGRKMSEMPNIFPKELRQTKTIVRSLGDSREFWYFTFDQAADRKLVSIWVLSGY
ncbi:MAG: hypothetical protein U0793_03330 [Gemmataceae bacterium]